MSSDISFVIANYGMTESPRSEEVIETVEAVRRRGFEGESLEQVAELADAAVDVMAAGFEGAWDAYDRVSAKYRDEPWMEALDGTTIGAFEKWPHWIVRLIGPHMAPAGLDWDYTSSAALDDLARRGIPSVWMIAEQDRSAPNEATLVELRRRIAAGEPLELEVFPDTDHGMSTFEEKPDGSREYGNYHPDYFRTEVAWARRLAGLEPAVDREGSALETADAIRSLESGPQTRPVPIQPEGAEGQPGPSDRRTPRISAAGS